MGMRIMNRSSLMIASVLYLMVLGTAVWAADPDQNAPVETTSQKPVGQVQSVAPVPGSVEFQQRQIDHAVQEQIQQMLIDSQKEIVGHYEFTLNIIIALVVALIGAAVIVLFRDRREYQDAVRDAKQSGRDAHTHATEARDIVTRLQDKLDDIDKLVKIKLDEIEEKGQSLIKQQMQEAEDQRKESEEAAGMQLKISDLWNKAQRHFVEKKYDEAIMYLKEMVKIKPNLHEAWNNWGTTLFYQAREKSGEEAYQLNVLACEKYAKALKIKPDYQDALSNWGISLGDQAKDKSGDEADKLYALALEKYAEAVKTKPDMHEAWYNWGSTLNDQAKMKSGDEADRLYNLAFEKYAEAVKIKPDYHAAWNNWGSTLNDQAKMKSDGDADQLYNLAGGKYTEAVKIKPDDYETWNNWGSTLLFQAQLPHLEREKGRLLQEAIEKCQKSEEIKRGSSAYNMACAYALLGNEAECRKWLDIGEKAGYLPPRDHAMNDPEFAAYLEKEWFKGIRWKVESKG